MKGTIRYPFSSSLLTNNDTSSAYLVADNNLLTFKGLSRRICITRIKTFFPPLTGSRDAVAFCDIAEAVEVVVTCAYLQLLLTHDSARTLLETSCPL